VCQAEAESGAATYVGRYVVVPKASASGARVWASGVVVESLWNGGAAALRVCFAHGVDEVPLQGQPLVVVGLGAYVLWPYDGKSVMLFMPGQVLRGLTDVCSGLASRRELARNYLVALWAPFSAEAVPAADTILPFFSLTIGVVYHVPVKAALDFIFHRLGNRQR